MLIWGISCFSGTYWWRKYLKNEAQIVVPHTIVNEVFFGQLFDCSRWKTIYANLVEKVEFLRNKEVVHILIQRFTKNPFGRNFNLWTWNSKLKPFPSYLTKGLVETIAKNQTAEKIFVSNIIKDHDIIQDSIKFAKAFVLFSKGEEKTK